MDVKEIIKAHLIAGGYDGLCCPDAGCACLVNDLIPCERPLEEMDACKPGYKFGSWIDNAGHSNAYNAGDLIEHPNYIVESLLIDELGIAESAIDHASLDNHRAWLAEEGGCRADLSGADLGRADLGGADLSGADLRRANLGRADLGRADLGGADLSGADLRGADLRGANLRRADLSGADLNPRRERVYFRRGYRRSDEYRIHQSDRKRCQRL